MAARSRSRSRDHVGSGAATSSHPQPAGAAASSQPQPAVIVSAMVLDMKLSAEELGSVPRHPRESYHHLLLPLTLVSAPTPQRNHNHNIVTIGHEIDDISQVLIAALRSLQRDPDDSDVFYYVLPPNDEHGGYAFTLEMAVVDEATHRWILEAEEARWI